jgi:hypothetical protein
MFVTAFGRKIEEIREGCSLRCCLHESEKALTLMKNKSVGFLNLAIQANEFFDLKGEFEPKQSFR